VICCDACGSRIGTIAEVTRRLAGEMAGASPPSAGAAQTERLEWVESRQL
jgi:hypothetical protein